MKSLLIGNPGVWSWREMLLSLFSCCVLTAFAVTSEDFCKMGDAKTYSIILVFKQKTIMYVKSARHLAARRQEGLCSMGRKGNAVSKNHLTGLTFQMYDFQRQWFLPCPEHNTLFPVAVEYISVVGNRNTHLYCSTYKPLSSHAISNFLKKITI